MVLSPTRLPRSNPLSYMQALPSGWDGLHLTEKWAQETGNGTCLIYMESCSEVTRKNEMNKCKRQSALLRPSRHFLLTILNLNIPALSFCQRTPRDLSKKKELYAEAQHALSQTNARNWALPNYFLSCPPHSAWAAETSVSVSVTDFHNQLKINDQCSSKPWWTKK